jgi:FkbM family methyltransferase
MATIRRRVRLFIRRSTGYDISKFMLENSLADRKRKLLQHYAIDRVLDVGANIGQYALELRTDLAYEGPIVSFEPMRSAFEALQMAARSDRKWDVRNYGIGAHDQVMTLNVAGNSASSSILPMLAKHADAAPQSKYIGTEDVTVRRLDSVIDEVGGGSRNMFLKVDVQGYESEVISGATRSLSGIPLVQLELSLVPLYGGQLLLPEMVLLMRERGYELIGVEPGFADSSSGRLLQVDGLFGRA